MTDNDYLLRVLSDGAWHSQAEILAASISDRGVGMTVHSRVSDLRKRGYIIANKTEGSPRRSSFYRLRGVHPLSVGALSDPSAARDVPSPVPVADRRDGSLSASPNPGQIPHSEEAQAGDDAALSLFPVNRGAYSEDAA